MKMLFTGQHRPVVLPGQHHQRLAAPRAPWACRRSQPLRVAAAEVMSPPSHDDSDDEDLQAMAELAEEEVHLLKSDKTPLGRGLIVQEAVKAVRTPVLSIPLEHALVISDDPLDKISIFGDKAQDAWQDCHGEMPSDLLDFIRGEQRWDVRLTAWLLWLLDNEGALTAKSPAWAKDSAAGLWDLYLHQLPDERDMSCLLNYNAEEAVELQIPRLIEEAKLQHDWVVYLHDQWFSKKTGKGPVALKLAHTVKETLWAGSMVRSRTFCDEVNGEGLTLMVPWADLANHSVDYNATFLLSNDRTKFELRNVRPLLAGEEVLISYGDNKSNAELMRDYGFVLPGNPCDRIPLPGDDLLSSDSLTEDQRRVVEALSKGPFLNGSSLAEAGDMQGDWMHDELTPMEDSLDTVEDMADWERRRSAILSLPLTDGYQNYGGACRGVQQGGSWGKPFTESGVPPPRKLKLAEVASEREAISRYLAHFKSLMGQLGTSIDTDVALLAGQSQGGQKGGPMTPRHRAAVQQRLEYKRLLAQGMAVLDVYDEYLAEAVQLPGK